MLAIKLGTTLFGSYSLICKLDRYAAATESVLELHAMTSWVEANDNAKQRAT